MEALEVIDAVDTASSLESNFDLRLKMRSLDLKIMDLAQMLDISRPTLYKMIECYQNNEFDKIPPHILGLFNYMQNPYINKNNVFVYVAENILKAAKSDFKGEFSKLIESSSEFDAIIEYLMHCHTLLKKENKSSEDIAFLAPLEIFIKNIGELKNND